MKIAFVIPRLEPQLAGGAEVLCQKLAVKVASRGHKVDVLTTCARDHFTWKNYYEPGSKVVNGITINKFLVDPNRIGRKYLSIQRKINRKYKISKKEEITWISDSIRSSDMEDYISKNRDRYGCFIFIPYLFGTTYWGIKLVKEKSILIPCLHNEPFAYLGIMKEMFNNVKGVMFNTEPEKDFAIELFGLNKNKISVVGLGFDTTKQYIKGSFAAKYGIKDPFILYAGRREEGKNIELLLNYFRIYKRNNHNKLKLVLLGSGQIALSNEDRNYIIDLGYISEEYKRSAYAESVAFCQPSINESLSIVIMESWLAGRPILVNEKCPVTLGHAKNSNGGLYFDNYPEFEECANYLYKNTNESLIMGQNGKEYVNKKYSWDAVLNRFDEGLKKYSEKCIS